MSYKLKKQINKTIPHFHDLEFRLQQFDTAIEMNLSGRYGEVKELVIKLMEYKEEMTASER